MTASWQEFAPGEGPAARLAVLGDPIQHSLSPSMQNAALRALGVAGVYHALRVPKDEFEQCVHHLASCGFVGANITVPHKHAAAMLAAAADAIVPVIGAANVMRFENGFSCKNTDVPAFLKALDTIRPGRALLLGAGGGAAAAAFALLSAGWQVSVWNRSPERAGELATRLRKHGNVHPIADPEPSGCSLVVNATALGLKPDEGPPLAWDNVARGTTIYDIAYREGPTEFLRRASERGLPTIDGREMLVEQGALSLEWWLGAHAPRDVMRKAVGL